MKKLGAVGVLLGMAFLAGCGCHHARSAANTPPPPQVVIVQVPAGSVVNPPATAQPAPTPPSK